MPDSQQFESICSLFLQTVNRYRRFEKETLIRAAGNELHLSEVHTIIAIGEQANRNITQLAKLQGISRSAVSQMVGKLVKKGFVKKSVSPQTDNEIILSLTPHGETVFTAHQRQHLVLKKLLADMFEKYPQNTLETLKKLAADMQALWDTLPL